MRTRHDALVPHWTAVLLLGAVAAAAFLTVDQPWVQGSLQIFMYALSAGLVTVAWWRTRRSRPDPVVRVAALAFAVFLCANAGGVVWPLVATAPIPSPSPLDVLFLVSYVLFAVALWMLGSRSTAPYRRDLLDTLIVSLGVIPVLWIQLVEPLLDGSALSFGLVAYLGYPVMVLVLLAMAVRAAFVASHPTVAHLLLAAWIGLELVADVVYLQTAATGSYSYGQAWQVLWLLSAACFGALVLHPRAALLLEPGTSRPASSQRRLYLLGTCVASPLVTLLFAHDVSERSELVSIAAGLALVVLVCLRLSGLMVNIAEQRRAKAELERLYEDLSFQSLHDPLTGLGNRALFVDRLDQALTQRATAPDRGAAVLLLDLDDFKTVNDTFGHAAGDRVLIEVGQRLQAIARGGETVFRLGGDEFALVLREARLEDALRLADRIREHLDLLLDVGPRQVRPLASIGVAIGLEGQDGSTLLAQADLAMYGAKRSGSGAPMVFDAGLHLEALARHQLERDLRDAVRLGQLRLVYQPVVRLATSDLIGVEALLRWEHPTRGTVSPLEFIPLAEVSGSILEIGLWVLRTASGQLAAWDASHPGSGLHMSVNVSPRQLADPEFVDQAQAVLAEAGTDPARITLEVTEAALGVDIDTMVERLHRLKDAGFSLAIDDFGTGYSSLSQLRRLPVDVLKIDKSFVAGIAREPAEWALTTAVVRLARSLGKTTLAEGIENGGHLAHLRSLDVDLGQGYLFSRPVDPDAVAALLDAAAGRAFLFD